jgi:cellular nucleic acid-binding protein
MTTNIYILRLDQGKYYIGKSDRVDKRLIDHVSGNGAAWTAKYKPVQLERVIQGASPFEEDRYTKEYMAKYGIDNVRGGSYVAVKLSEAQQSALESELRTATDACFHCGRTGHYMGGCYAKRNAKGFELLEDEEEKDEEEEDEEDEEGEEDDDEDEEDDEED